jgi:hypothetical protein
VTSSIVDASPRQTLIQKVLVLGENPARMAGFVNRASGSNIAYHLYASLGVGIGVARTVTNDDTEIIMQLWLIPPDEKVPGINRNFKRGSSGAVVVLQGDQIPMLSSYILSIPPDCIYSTIVLVIGSDHDAQAAASVIEKKFGIQVDHIKHGRVSETISRLGRILLDKYRGIEQPRVYVARMDESQCPEYNHISGQSHMPECTQDDIDMIISTAYQTGAEVSQRSAIIALDEGEFEVTLKDGAVSFTPTICSLCSRNCPRRTNICIVGIDRGWSSDGIGERALLVISKIWAISSRQLPIQVQKQIRFASQCRHFTSKDDNDLQVVNTLAALGYRSTRKKKPLLQEAEERVDHRMLSTSALDILRNRLNAIRGLYNREGD